MMTPSEEISAQPFLFELTDLCITGNYPHASAERFVNMVASILEFFEDQNTRDGIDDKQVVALRDAFVLMLEKAAA
jgi:hypothetical protein